VIVNMHGRTTIKKKKNERMLAELKFYALCFFRNWAVACDQRI
jgi:hypothetical protein